MQYELYTVTSARKTYTKKITRKNPMSDESKERVSGSFADYIVDQYDVSVVLWGCNEVNIINEPNNY